MRWLYRAIACYWLGVSALYAAEPSFDCAKSNGEIEALICQDDSLAALDRELAQVYKTALDNAPGEERATLKATQRGWIKGRNDCWKAADKKACTQTNYEQRITALQIMAVARDHHRPNLKEPKPCRHRCCTAALTVIPSAPIFTKTPGCRRRYST